MKLNVIIVALAAVCGSAFAQSPTGAARPTQEQNPNMSGGVAQQRGEMRNDMRTGMADHSAMDTNHDGMISRKEWNAYNESMWRSMKADKSGNVRWDDVNTRMMGGGTGGPVGKGGQVGNAPGGTPK